MTLQEIGALLRQERKRQGKSVEEIMDATRISRRNIVAIENGDEDDLPHPVYAKGFLRSYARVLGLDSEELADRLSEAYSPEEAEEDEPLTAREGETIRQPPEPARRSSWVVILVVVVLLGVLGWLVWMMNSPAEEEPAPEPAVETPAPEPPEPPASEMAEPQPDQPPVSATEETEADVPTEAELETAAPEEEPSSLAPAPEEEAPAQAEPTEAVTPRVLRVIAKEEGECWMQARVDDGRIKEAYIRNGQTVAFTFDETLWLRLGNAGGVKLMLNGEPMELDARPGQVKTLTLP
jgi:cytoskeleton protein RodZ